MEGARGRPDKKQRDEIEDLRAELGRVREEFHDKEKRLMLAIQRHKDRIQELTDKNAELEAELKVLERDRISEWSRRNKGEKESTSLRLN